MRTDQCKHLALAVFLGAGLSGAAWAAQPVPITNAGFEQPVLVDGTLSSGVPGWTAFNGGDIAVLNPATSDLGTGAPEGENVGLVMSTTNEDGLAQTLTSTFQADASYELKVKVANTKLTAGFPGYRVQLLAGGTLLAEDDNTQTIAEDAVAPLTVSYSYDAEDAGLVGQLLVIRLLSKGLSSGQEVAFDDVQLTVALANPVAHPGGPYAVPPAGSLSLDGSGSLPSDGQTITLYEWDINNDNDFSDATGATPDAISDTDLVTIWEMTMDEANTIQLRVTDSASKTSTVSTTVTPLSLVTTTITGTAGGTDSWNTASNWDNGVPSGAVYAVVAEGVTAQVLNAATPSYSGTLTLDPNAILSIGNTGGSQNAVVGASSIVLNAGSELRWNINANLNFPPITLKGDALFRTPFGASDHQTDNFAAMTGDFKLTINGFNNHAFNLNAANTFSELVADAIDRYRILAKAAGSLGTGDVTINKRSNDDRGCVLVIDAADAMADTATLRLHGKGWNGSSGGALPGTFYALRMNANDTIKELWVDGVQQAAGTYTGGDGQWIGGTGILTVLTGPGTGSPYDEWTAGPFADTLTDTSPALDFDGGGLATGIEWVVGGDPTVGSDDAGNAPTFDNSDPDKFVFSFKRRDLAAADANTSIAVQYSTSLATESWMVATDGVDGVTLDDSGVPEAGFHTVVVSIPKALAPGGRLFARLKVAVTMR